MKPLVTTDIDLENQEANANDNDEEQERLTLIVRQGERLEDEERDYDDYYDHISRSPSIRPITVTEGVNFSRMRIGKKILWWCITTLNLLRYSDDFFQNLTSINPICGEVENIR